MTIKNFIERAIEGGWTIQGSYYASPVKYSKLKSSNGYWTVIETDKIVTVEVNYQEEKVPMTVTHQTNTILLDPLAWAAVGNAIGKTNIHGGLITMCRNCSVESGANSLGACDYCGGHEWGNFQRWDRYSMSRFIDSLCDGLTLEEALKRATS